MDNKYRRIGKVKIYSEEGALIREGHARESDFGEKKIFKVFTPSELIKATILAFCFTFTAGGLWFTLNDHFKNLDGSMAVFVQTFSDFKQQEQDFHKTIFNKLDDKDTRINCLAQGMSRCCKDSTIC